MTAAHLTPGTPRRQDGGGSRTGRSQDAGGAHPPVRLRLAISGVVQGVGFRPFVHTLAGQLGLGGFVTNHAGGVVAEVEGAPEQVAVFCARMRTQAPPLATVADVLSTPLPPLGEGSAFAIRPSRQGEGRTMIPPDAAVCGACAAELADPADRRHRHPFITCTHCGPRFTIVTGLPYDRAATTMARFPLCEACAREYADPSDRRFHAQPVACPHCGPRLFLTAGDGGARLDGREALARARRMLAEGEVVAVKGLGGYHLACDAQNEEAVARLRARKERGSKPFAVMVADLRTAAAIAPVSEAEAETLTSRRRPIVLLRLPHGPADGTPAPDAHTHTHTDTDDVTGPAPHHADTPTAPVDTPPSHGSTPARHTDTPAAGAAVGRQDGVPSARRSARPAHRTPLLPPSPSGHTRTPDSAPDAHHTHRSPTHPPLPDTPPHTDQAHTRQPGTPPTGACVPGLRLAAGVCPGGPDVGVMLPYTPLHHLLFGLAGDAPGPRVLVMTSGNRSGEPIVTDDTEALTRLSGIADAWLGHDRGIRVPCDDSVVRVRPDGTPLPVRRSRGHVPEPVALPFDVPPTLAVGGDLKNVFCLAQGGAAWLSQHIGDLDDPAAARVLDEAQDHLSALTGVRPALLAADRHPGYRSVRWASRAARGRPLHRVQHHHAHVASAMADAGLDGARPVIGVAFDGTGYGDDGAVWGGEVMLADYDGYRRLTRLAYVPMPGGDAAVRRPYRMALSHLRAAGVEWSADLPCVAACPPGELRVLRRQLERSIACVPTSSMGRLFDAVSALLGVCPHADHEAQAAVELEARAAPAMALRSGPYSFGRTADGLLDAAPLMRALVEDLRAGTAIEVMAARFHLSVADTVAGACRAARRDTGVSTVALTGGVFANMLLEEACTERLRAERFTVLRHRHVPCGDGGLALGQVLVAARRQQRADGRTGRRAHSAARREGPPTDPPARARAGEAAYAATDEHPASRGGHAHVPGSARQSGGH